MRKLRFGLLALALSIVTTACNGTITAPDAENTGALGSGGQQPAYNTGALGSGG